MSEWCIVNIGTGSIVERGFSSRGEANSQRWLNYENGSSNDEDYQPNYGVDRINE